MIVLADQYEQYLTGSYTVLERKLYDFQDSLLHAPSYNYYFYYY